MLTQLVLAFFLLIALEGAEAQQIDSPTALVQCSPARLTFSGGVPPYIIDVIPGGEPGAVALESISAVASPITWTVDLAAGTNITLRLRDSTGALAFSSPVVIQPSSDESCLGQNSASTITATDSAIASSTSAISSSGISSITPTDSTSEISTVTSEILTSPSPSSSLSPLLPPSTTVAAPSAESPVTRAAATSESASSFSSVSLSLLAFGSFFAVVGASA